MKLRRAGFLFEAQTGRIFLERPKAPSNFHRYALPAACLARVKLAVEAATIGSGGLEYPREFLDWLDRNQIDRPGSYELEMQDGVYAVGGES